MQEDNDSVNTMKNYLPDVEKFLTFINKDPIELDRIDVIKYINDLKNHELNAKTINRKIYAIYKFIQFLNNDYDLKINFNIKKLKMRIAKQEYGRDLLTKTDFKRILNAAYKDENIMFATLMLTLYLTGMRISEALNIKLKDIKKKEIIVTGKANKQRYIPIPDDLRKHFRECAAYRKDSKEEYLFLNKHGRRLTAWMADYYIKRYAGKTKVLWYKNELSENDLDDLFLIDEIKKKLPKNAEFGNRNGGTTIQLPFGFVQWHSPTKVIPGSIQFHHNYIKIKELMEG